MTIVALIWGYWQRVRNARSPYCHWLGFLEFHCFGESVPLECPRVQDSWALTCHCLGFVASSFHWLGESWLSESRSLEYHCDGDTVYMAIRMPLIWVFDHLNPTDLGSSPSEYPWFWGIWTINFHCMGFATIGILLIGGLAHQNALLGVFDYEDIIVWDFRLSESF